MPFVGRTATSMTDEVLRRVRDANGVMHTASFVRDRLTDAQRYLNGILGLVITSSTLTLNPGQNFYKLSDSLPLCIRVVGLRGSFGNRELAELPSIDSLMIYGPRWTRAIGPYIESWTTVGRDVLVIYPAIFQVATIDAFYVKLCNAFSSGATVSEFSTEQCGLIVTLTEALLLLRQRDLAAAGRAMDRLQQALTPETELDRLGTIGSTQLAVKAANPK